MAFYSEPLLDNHRIQLAVEDYARTLSFGSNWTKIRLGFTVGWTGHVPTFQSAGLVYGLSKGTACTFSNPTLCEDFIGIGYSASWPLRETWTWTNSAYYVRGGGSGTPRYINRVAGNADVVGAVGANPQLCQLPANGSFSAAYALLDITKNSPYSITLVTTWQSLVSSFATPTFTNVIRTQEDEGLTLSPQPIITSTASSVTIAYSGNMGWDSVNFAWDCFNPCVEIGTIVVTRYY